MEWTEETISRLRELWAEGLSTAEIGRRLSITKNAVVGKAHRLSLPPRPSPIRRGEKKQPAATPKAAAPAAASPTKAEATPEQTVQAVTAPVASPQVEKPAQAATAPQAAPEKPAAKVEKPAAFLTQSQKNAAAQHAAGQLVTPAHRVSIFVGQRRYPANPTAQSMLKLRM